MAVPGLGHRLPCPFTCASSNMDAMSSRYMTKARYCRLASRETPMRIQGCQGRLQLLERLANRILPPCKGAGQSPRQIRPRVASRFTNEEQNRPCLPARRQHLYRQPNPTLRHHLSRIQMRITGARWIPYKTCCKIWTRS